MVLLAFNSSGNDALDLAEVRARLERGKKVLVYLDGEKRSVTDSIMELFGKGALQDIREHEKDQGRWVCELRSSPDTAIIVPHTGKKEEERRRDFLRLVGIDHEGECTPDIFLDCVIQLLSSIPITEESQSAILESLTEEARSLYRQYAHLDVRHQLEMIRSFLGERLIMEMMAQHLEQYEDHFQQVLPNDVDIHHGGYRVAEGRYPYNTLLKKYNKGEGFVSFHELDFVYKTGLQQYVGFDVTVGDGSKPQTMAKTARLNELRTVAGLEMYHIDVQLRAKRFAVREKSQYLRSISLPCMVDFEKVAKKMVS